MPINEGPLTYALTAPTIFDNQPTLRTHQYRLDRAITLIRREEVLLDDN